MMRPRVSRTVVTASHGMVATSHPLASHDGLVVLREGGNAIDAAVTAAASLTVVEPTMTGIGGDLFALLFMANGQSVRALNASGRSPRAASLESAPPGGLPDDGILSVTVPGAVDGWDRLLREHGTISLARALAPAIEHARSGFEVTPVVARQWAEAVPLLSKEASAAATFLIDGRAPRAGERFLNPMLATSLERLATGGRDELYEGALGQRIHEASRRRGGWLVADDLRSHRSDWVTPIRTTFRGYEVVELPPNTQGLTALELLNLLEDAVDPAATHDDLDYCHRLIEATRIAFSDRDAYVADADWVPADTVERLISKDYARLRGREIVARRAALGYRPGLSTTPPPTPRPSGARQAHGDTVYLAAADRMGNAASLIQSLFGTFGSGVVVEGTGIVLHNRGSLFSSDATHPNRLAPRKRPFHTLIPALVLEDGLPWLVYGVMGGHMQAQGHAQILMNLLAFGMDVQEAAAAARLRWTGSEVALERGGSPDLARGLSARGHRVVVSDSGFGGFQGIRIAGDGGLSGGSDPRKDGCAVGY